MATETGLTKQSPRLTTATMAVLSRLMNEEERHYGFAIGEHTGLASGTVMPILARLESAGWVTSHWEDVDPKQAGRPRRRYYELTSDGAARAREALQASAARHRKLASQVGAWEVKGAPA